MRHTRTLTAALLASIASLVASSPVQTASPQLPATRTRVVDLRAVDARAAAPDISIPPVSIPPVPDVSIPPLSLDLPSNTCHPTIKPGKDGYVPPGECNALWNYFPSFAAAIAFAILFGVLFIAHLGQAIHHKTAFAWVIVMATLWESVSYITRAAGSKDQQSEGLATVSQLLVLLSPLWVNAFAYMVFARIVNFFAPTRKVWVLSPSIMAFIFVTLDIVSFIIQLIGGGMAGPGADPATQKKGINIYMGGIGMQEGFIVVFIGLIVKFHLDQLRAERSGVLSLNRRSWRPVTYALYACLLFITVRIIFRLVEFSGGEGTNNPLPNTESYFYGLDGAPMWLALVVWNGIHPGRYMSGPDAKMPPSIFSKYLCCCCRRKNKDGLGPHKPLQDPQADDFNEMNALNTQDGSPPAKRWNGQGNGIYQQVGSRGRDLQPYTGYDSSRDISSERSGYPAAQPRDFS